MSLGTEGAARGDASARPTRHRLFFALWPTDEFRARIEATTRAIVRASGGRMIPAVNFHVTLLFLGDVTSENLSVVQEAGSDLAGLPAFELNFDAVEAWGRKLLCLTASTPPSAAVDLSARLRSSLGNVPWVRLDDHDFRPHITLARDLPRGRRPEKITALRQEVNDFVLVESVRDATGSHYTVLERWPLSG